MSDSPWRFAIDTSGFEIRMDFPMQAVCVPRPPRWRWDRRLGRAAHRARAKQRRRIFAGILRQAGLG